jgi:hypothetical protein
MCIGVYSAICIARCAQRQAHTVAVGKREGNFTFHNGSVGNTPRSRHAARDGSCSPACGYGTGGKGTLRHRVDFPIRAKERCDKQRAAGQVRGIAKG